MADTFINTCFVIVLGIIIFVIVMLLLDIKKNEKSIEELQNQNSAVMKAIKNMTEGSAAYESNLNDLDERLSEMENNIRQIRAEAQRTILAECAKFGLHPTDYVAKHAKPAEQQATVIPSFSNADPDKEYLSGHDEENAKNFKAQGDDNAD